MCASCSSFDLPAPPNATTDATDEGSSTAGSETEGDLDRATVTHAFGLATLGPFEEIEPCVSWTLDNEQALYVQAVTLANESGFHHSNWFVVPESVYEGPDGYWNCDDRGFEEIASAAAGTVLFAQSTQSWLETQRLGEGAVIKIPARSLTRIRATRFRGPAAAPRRFTAGAFSPWEVFRKSFRPHTWKMPTCLSRPGRWVGKCCSRPVRWCITNIGPAAEGASRRPGCKP